MSEPRADYRNSPHGDSGPKQGRRLGTWIYAHPDQPNYLRVDKCVSRPAANVISINITGTEAVGSRELKAPTPNTQNPLYRLPELMAAAPIEPVWICEGEKDADNVAALGLIATTSPGGAGFFQTGVG